MHDPSDLGLLKMATEGVEMQCRFMKIWPNLQHSIIQLAGEIHCNMRLHYVLSFPVDLNPSQEKDI